MIDRFIQSMPDEGEPATERNHKKGIEPNGERWASYSVGASALTGQGPYEATVRLLAQPVPVNLLIGSQKVGFDFGMTPAELGRTLIAGTQELWKKKLTLGVGAPGASRLTPKGAWAPTLTPAPSAAPTRSSRKGEWKKGVFANE